jgi:hypothetical protein
MKWNYKRIAVCFTVLVAIVVAVAIFADRGNAPEKPSGTPSPTKSSIATPMPTSTPTAQPTNAAATPTADAQITVPVSSTEPAPTQAQDISPEPTALATEVPTPVPTQPDDMTPTPAEPTDPVEPIPTQTGDFAIETAKAKLIGLGAERLGLTGDIDDYSFEGDEITTVYKGADYYRFDAFTKQEGTFSGTFMVALDGKSIYTVDEYSEFIEIPLT